MTSCFVAGRHPTGTRRMCRWEWRKCWACLVSLLRRRSRLRAKEIVIQRALTDGYEVVEAPLPALVTVTNELGEPRYPTLRGIMQASRKQPTSWSTADVGLNAGALEPKVMLTELYIPVSDNQVEVIEGEDDADAGRKLALRLREEKLI